MPLSKKIETDVSKRPKAEQLHDMSVEVRDWIASAFSRINHLTSEVERLKAENVKLKLSNKVMESRVMGSSYE